MQSAVKVEVPEGLAERIILAQRMRVTTASIQAGSNVTPIRKPNVNSGRGQKWMSLAAALVLALGLSFGMFQWGQSQGLQNEVLAHIESHLYELDVDKNIQLASLNDLLQEHGLSANEGIGHVRHAANCPIEGKMVPHIVCLLYTSPSPRDRG